MNKSDYRANIESILLGYYIKYIKLEEITANTLAVSKYGEMNEVDIYIDLYDMLKKLYTTDIYATKQFTIVSSVINLAAHMREFYWSRYNVNTRIFLVYGDETSINHKQFYLAFGGSKICDTRDYEKVNSIVESQLDMIKLLCAYIYGVYFVRKSTDFSMFVYDNILKNPNMPAIVISKSRYAYQIPAMCENAFLFRPKKYNGEDVSFGVTHDSVLFQFCNKLNNNKTLEQLRVINPKLLSLIISLNGLPSKKLLTMVNITTAIGRVYKAITENKIINGYNTDINFVYNQLELFSIIDQDNFRLRFNAVDLVFQYRLYCNMSESKDISWLIDLRDPDTVKGINNKYFTDNPLDLNAL